MLNVPENERTRRMSWMLFLHSEYAGCTLNHIFCVVENILRQNVCGMVLDDFNSVLDNDTTGLFVLDIATDVLVRIPCST